MEVKEKLKFYSESGISVVNKGNRYNTVEIWTRSEFFKEPIIIKDDGDCLVIKKPTIDYRGRVLSPSYHKKNKGYHTNLSNTEMPPGRYYFDEEDSTEDKLVIYYNE